MDEPGPSTATLDSAAPPPSNIPTNLTLSAWDISRVAQEVATLLQSSLATSNPLRLLQLLWKETPSQVASYIYVLYVSGSEPLSEFLS